MTGSRTGRTWPFAAVALLFSGALSAEPLFEVVRHDFCGQVVNREPAGAYESPTTLQPRGPLLFWMEIKVTRGGYRYLRAYKRLPVFVAWGRDGWLTGRPIDIGITEETWERTKGAIAWKLQSSEDDKFTWRTYAQRPAPIRPGTYYVSIIDANQNAVPAGNTPDGDVRPELIVQ